jgi:hypothetical protein
MLRAMSHSPLLQLEIKTWPSQGRTVTFNHMCTGYFFFFIISFCTSYSRGLYQYPQCLGAQAVRSVIVVEARYFGFLARTSN